MNARRAKLQCLPEAQGGVSRKGPHPKSRRRPNGGVAAGFYPGAAQHATRFACGWAAPQAKRARGNRQPVAGLERILHRRAGAFPAGGSALLDRGDGSGEFAEVGGHSEEVFSAAEEESGPDAANDPKKKSRRSTGASPRFAAFSRWSEFARGRGAPGPSSSIKGNRLCR
jgi:hypothetical protein